MFDFAAHIEYLLMSHDCVVAPGLGAFLVHETPAHYDGERCLFVPPMRSLGFNAAVTLNDGLLAESIARRERVSLDEARVRVDSAVASFRSQLEQSGTLPVGNLGMMSQHDGALLFEPSAHSAVAMRYLGLGAVSVKPLVTDVPAWVDEAEVETPARRRFVSLSMKIAASLIIAIMACGIFFTTDRLIGDSVSNYASLDSGLREHVCSLTPVAAPAESLALSREIQLNIAVPAPTEITDLVAVVQQSPEISDRYLLVVASFTDIESAKRHIGDDTRLSIKEMDGNYRVYISTADNINAAHNQADALRDEFPSVWICRR